MSCISRIKFLFFVLIGIIFVNGCEQPKSPVHFAQNTEEQTLTREALLERNRRLIETEMELIAAYVDRNALSMDTTSTGLRLAITEKSNGRMARLMDRVSVSYTMNLLNGNLCYTSDSTGLLELTIGQSDEPSGLQEALLRMKEGEKATLIVPSYLAYGTTGDGLCVPGSSSLIYHIKLEKILEP